MGWFAADIPEEETVAGAVTSDDRHGRRTFRVVLEGSRLGLRTLWIAADTCTPVSVLFERERTMVDEPDAGASSPHLVRVEHVYPARRVVSGVLVPTQVNEFVGERLVEEWPLLEVGVNSPLDATLFQVPQGR
jgi:hypothetical protein